jgi:succinylglutamate desuccinylase
VLKILDKLPEGLIELEATQLYDALGGPALIHLPGRREQPLFMSVLLHGNEVTGWHAIQSLLEKYRNQELPRALSIFIGNVEAAKQGMRRLEGQPDYNRVWPGSVEAKSPEQEMMRQVVDEMKARNVFASLDIHNNTGLNPHYACVNRIDDRFFHMATMFSRTVVYFTRPEGVQSAAFAKICPAVTVECGQVGQAYGDKHAFEYLEACLHLSEHPEHPVAEHDIDLFHTVAIVKIPQDVEFGFDEADSDIVFKGDLDHLNFRELKQGTRIGTLRDGADARLQAWNNAREDVGDNFFHYQDNEIVLTRPVMPSMLTLNKQVIRQDCLCYLMERYDTSGVPRE